LISYAYQIYSLIPISFYSLLWINLLYLYSISKIYFLIILQYKIFMNCFLLLLLIILGLDTLNIYIKFDHSKFEVEYHFLIIKMVSFTKLEIFFISIITLYLIPLIVGWATSKHLVAISNISMIYLIFWEHLLYFRLRSDIININ
jgi:hypothetical protein